MICMLVQVTVSPCFFRDKDGRCDLREKEPGMGCKLRADILNEDWCGIKMVSQSFPQTLPGFLDD